MNIPQDVKDHLITWFNFPDSDIFCQVSTLANMQPHVRTMKLYDVSKNGTVIFITSTTTRKWKNLQSNPSIAICLFQTNKGQVLIEGVATLHTKLDSPTITRHYWQQMPEEWRQFYLSHDTKTPSSDNIPASFGVIEVTPSLWETLEINQKDYLKSIRKQYKMVVDIWVCHDLSPV